MSEDDQVARAACRLCAPLGHRAVRRAPQNWVNAWTAKHPWLYALSFSAIVFAYSVGYGVFFRREHLVTALPTAVISGIIIFVLSTWRTKRWGPRQEQSTSAPRR